MSDEESSASGKGFGISALVALLLFFAGFLLNSEFLLWNWPGLQALVSVPAALVAKRGGRADLVPGLVVGAALGVLLNVPCWLEKGFPWDPIWQLR